MEPDHKDYDAAQDLLEYFKSMFVAARDEGTTNPEFVARVMFCAVLDVTMDQFGESYVARWLRNSADEIERRLSKGKPIENIHQLH